MLKATGERWYLGHTVGAFESRGAPKPVDNLPAQAHNRGGGPSWRTSRQREATYGTGDQAGKASLAGLSVSLVTSVPSTFIT